MTSSRLLWADEKWRLVSLYNFARHDQFDMHSLINYGYNYISLLVFELSHGYIDNYTEGGAVTITACLLQILKTKETIESIFHKGLLQIFHKSFSLLL